MKYSKLGYKRYSPDLYNKYNVIPSGRITMQDVDFPVFGMDDMGNTQMMYPGGEYQFPGNQVFEIPIFQNGSETFDESIREQLVASANRIIDSKDFYRLSPEKAAIVKENRGNPNELTCIGGVCRILKEADLIPQVIESNTDFVQQAESLGFSKPGFDLTKLRPGDIIQHFGSSNQSGKGYPTHAQMYIGQDEDGNYKFFDNYRGTSQWYGKKGYKSYSEKDLKQFLELGKAGKSKGAQLIYLNPNAEIDYRTQEELQAIQSKKDSRARRLPVETFKDEMYSGPDYFSEIVNTQDLPYAYMPSEGANKNEKDLIGLFNSQEFDRTLRETFGVSDQTLETLKPIIYGIMKQESNFGNPETLGRVAKYKLENLFSPPSLSTGPAAVRYKDLRDPAKTLLGNSSRSLNTMKGAYIGALDSLLTAGSISDAYQINNPELADKDPWTAALYFYNGQGRSLRRGKNIEGDALRMDPGSYPSKVFENTKDLRRFVPFDSDVSDPDVYRYPYDIQVTPKEEEVVTKKQAGGQTTLLLGYDSMYRSPAAAFRYMMNPQDDSKYYGEVFGTKQGPGVAVGLDYDNQKYGTQGMIRLGADPLRGASIRAQGGKRYNPIDNRREELSWGPYGGVNWQTNDYVEFDGTGNQLAYNNIRPRLTAGLNAQYEKELDNRGRISIEGDLGVGIGNKYGDMGQFQPEPYAAINATYSFPRYKNTRTERPQPTTYSSGYKQGGGQQLQIPQPFIRTDFFTREQVEAARDAQVRKFATPATGNIEGEGVIDVLLPVVAKPIAKAIAKPLMTIVGDAASYATTQTPLRNAWRLNPRAYQYNLPENTMWRGLGQEGMEDAVSSGVFRSKQNVPVEYFPGSNLRASKSFGTNPYFTPKFKTAAEYGDNFIAEVPRGTANWSQRYKRSDWSQVANRPIPIEEGRILQKDWLRGYKPLDISKQTGGEQLQMRKGNTFDDYIFNPAIKAMAAAGDYLGPIVNQALDDVSSAAMNAMYTSPTLAPLAIKAQGAVRPWLFQNIRPVEYPGIVSGAVNLTKGVLGLNAPPSRDPNGRYSIGEEAWQRALGNPTQSYYIIPSKYKPSKAKDADAQYYTLNRDVIDPQLLIAEAKKRNIQEGQSIVLPSLAPYIREGFMPREEFSQIDPLQNFTIGRGKDERGNYISIYDKYDFEGPLNTLTSPYEFYDRYYYKGGGQHGGLDRWFAEKWVDVKTGKECGRQSGEKRKGYPACRPSKRVNSKTPKTASELSSAEKAKFKREKTSSQRISYQHKRSEYGGSIPRFRSDLY